MKWRCVCVRRGELLLVPRRCYDAADAGGGFRRVLGPLHGGGEGAMQVGRGYRDYYVLVLYMYMHMYSIRVDIHLCPIAVYFETLVR